LEDILEKDILDLDIESWNFILSSDTKRKKT